jgi:predicted nucleic acid-binding protein
LPFASPSPLSDLLRFVRIHFRRAHAGFRPAAEKSLVAELSELIREGRGRLIGLVRRELLSGIKSTEHYEKLRLHLRSFPDEPITTSDHEEAAKAGNRCRGTGIVVSIVDVLLFAVAIMASDHLLSYETYFEGEMERVRRFTQGSGSGLSRAVRSSASSV